MGNRVSVSFKDTHDESVALFSHWQGKDFVNDALDYLESVKARGKGQVMPLDRLEPSTLMVDFIRHITKGMEVVDSDLYLGKDGNDGDNSDNGHYAIDVRTGRFE